MSLFLVAILLGIGYSAEGSEGVPTAHAYGGYSLLSLYKIEVNKSTLNNSEWMWGCQAKSVQKYTLDMLFCGRFFGRDILERGKVSWIYLSFY
jgi:hypothetical protein